MVVQASPVEVAQEVAEALLAHQVEPDRGLVEEQDLWVVKKRGDQLALHPLAQAQLSNLDVEPVL